MSEGDGMSILIKREMPKGCWACPFAVGKHYECLFTKKSYNWGLTTRPSDCPLIEITTPHGRLIDADALMRDIEEYHLSDGKFQHWVEVQQTVIEAEGSET